MIADKRIRRQCVEMEMRLYFDIRIHLKAFSHFRIRTHYYKRTLKDSKLRSTQLEKVRPANQTANQTSSETLSVISVFSLMLKFFKRQRSTRNSVESCWKCHIAWPFQSSRTIVMRCVQRNASTYIVHRYSICWVRPSCAGHPILINAAITASM